MSNTFGTAYGLTMISPIVDGRTHGVHHAEQIRATLARLGLNEHSPFARVPQTHTARWFLIDDLISQSYPAQEDHLQSRYLVFVADFDSTLENFIKSLVTTIPHTIDAVWTHCNGYPGSGNWRAVLDYVRDCQIETTEYFGGYKGASAADVLRALYVQRRMNQFIQDSAHLPSGELQAAFARFREELANAATPSPGRF